MKKRILATFLAFVMLIGLLPMQGLAWMRFEQQSVCLPIGSETAEMFGGISLFSTVETIYLSSSAMEVRLPTMTIPEGTVTEDRSGARVQAVDSDGAVVGQTAGFTVYESDDKIYSKDLFFLEPLSAGDYSLQLIYGDVETAATFELSDVILTVVDAPVVTYGYMNLYAGDEESTLTLRIAGYDGEPDNYYFELLDIDNDETIPCTAHHVNTDEYSYGIYNVEYILIPETELTGGTSYALTIGVSEGALYSSADEISDYASMSYPEIAILAVSPDESEVGGVKIEVGGIKDGESCIVEAYLSGDGGQLLCSDTFEPEMEDGNGIFYVQLKYNDMALPLSIYNNIYFIVESEEAGDRFWYYPESHNISQYVNLELTQVGDEEYEFVLTGHNMLLDLYEQTDELEFELRHYDSDEQDYVTDSVKCSDVTKGTYTQNETVCFTFSGTFKTDAQLDADTYYRMFYDENELAGSYVTITSDDGLSLSSITIHEYDWDSANEEYIFYFNYGYLPVTATLSGSESTACASLYNVTTGEVEAVSESVSGTIDEDGEYTFEFMIPDPGTLSDSDTYTLRFESGGEVLSLEDSPRWYSAIKYDPEVEEPSYSNINEPIFAGDETLTVTVYRGSGKNMDASHLAGSFEGLIHTASEIGVAVDDEDAEAVYSFDDYRWYVALKLDRALRAGEYTYGEYDSFTVLPNEAVVLGSARWYEDTESLVISECSNLPEGSYTGVMYIYEDNKRSGEASLSFIRDGETSLTADTSGLDLISGYYTIELWWDEVFLGAVGCSVDKSETSVTGPVIRGYAADSDKNLNEIEYFTDADIIYLQTYLDGYAYVRYSENKAFSKVDYQPIRDYYDQPIELSEDNGKKTVYVQFKNSAGDSSDVYTWTCEKVESLETPQIIYADIKVDGKSAVQVPAYTDFTLQVASNSKLCSAAAVFVESDGSEYYEEYLLSYVEENEDGYLFECTLNSGDYPFHTSISSFKSVNIYLKDVSGYTEYDMMTIPFSVSASNNDIYLDAWGSKYYAYTNQTEFTITGTATPGSEVTLTINYGEPLPSVTANPLTGAFSFTLSDLTEGSYYMSFEDSAGLMKTRYFIVDRTAPVITSLKAVLVDNDNSAVTWEYSGNNLDSFLLYRDGILIKGMEGGWKNYTSYTDTNYIAIDAEGATFTLIAIDRAGNRSEEHSVTIGDDEAPSTPGTPAITSHGTKSISFEWEAATDNVAVHEYEIYRNDTLIETVPYTQLSYTDDELTEGTTYTYTLYATDRSGNKSETPSTADLSTATLTISESTALKEEYIKEEYTNTGVSVYAWLDGSDSMYDLSDALVKLQYKRTADADWSELALDKLYNLNYSGIWVIEDLEPGDYTVRFLAVDAEGTKKNTTEATVKISQDTVPPTVSIYAPEEGETYGGKDFAVSGGAEDNVAVDRVVISYAPVGSDDFTQAVEAQNPEKEIRDWNWQAQWDASSLASGSYQVKAEAYDIRNNVSDASVVTVTIDNTPPADVKDFSVTGTSRYIHINWGYDALPLDNDFKEFRIYRGTSDDKSTFELVRTQGLILGCFEDGTTISADTKYYYYVTAVDVYGNESLGSEVLSAKLTADNESPTIGDMIPADGASLCNSAEIFVTAADNYRLSKAVFEYRKVGDDSWTLIGEKAAPEASNNTVFDYSWDISSVDTGKYEIRVSVYDDSINDIDENNNAYTANPAAVKSCTVTITKYTPPTSPVLSAKGGYKNVTLEWTYSGDASLLSGFDIYRADTVDGDYQTVKTVSASTRKCTLAVPLDATYYYKIVARDRYDAKETSNIVSGGSEGTDTEAPVAVISPETLLAAVNVPFMFSAVNSTDNDAIASYMWEFGDGSTSTEKVASHTYTEDGTYSVRLTVTDDAGNKDTVSADVTVIDVAAENGEYTLVTFNVVDASEEDTPALEGATLKISSDIEGEDGTTAVTDENGQASVLLPRGQHTVSVSCAGYMPRGAKLIVTYQESGVQTVTLGISSTSLVSGELTATEMTYDEIVAAGIDVNDPDNEHVWKFATVLEFSVGLETFEIPVVAGYKNSAGEFINGSGGWFSLGGGGGGSGGGMGGGFGSIGIFPMFSEGFYLVIYGEAHWLKEMYNVELLVINNSNTDTIENCTGTLVLPEGLSLAAMMHKEQSETIDLGKIAEGDRETATWYVRGDEAGEYYLTANVSGEFQSGDGVCTPFATSFTTSEPIRVYAGNALHMTITAQDYAVRGEDYEVTFRLENVSDKSLYNLSFGITGIEQYKVIGLNWVGCYIEGEPLLLDKKDFEDSMTKTVPELAPGGFIEIKVSTTIWFNSAAEIAEVGVDLFLKSKAGLGGAVLSELVNVVYYLNSVDVVTLGGSTTSVPYTVNIEQRERKNILDVIIKAASKEIFFKDLMQGSIGGMAISVVGDSINMDKTMIAGAKSMLSLMQGETDYTFEISINDGTGSPNCIENDYIKITSGDGTEGIFDFLNGTGWKVNGTELTFEAKLPGTTEIKISAKNKYGELEREYTLNVTVEDTVLKNKITLAPDGVDHHYRVNESTLDLKIQEQYEEEYAQFEKNPFTLNPSSLIFELEASGSDYNFSLRDEDLNTITEKSGTTVVTVDGADVDISVSVDALEQVMGEGAELVIGTRLLSPEENASLGLEGTTYEFIADVDEVRVSKFGDAGDEVTVSIDYDLPANVTPEDLVILCIRDDNTVEMLDCTYDEVNKTVTFQTGHFSYYNIQTADMDEVKAEAKSEIEQIAAERIAAIGESDLSDKDKSALTKKVDEAKESALSDVDEAVSVGDVNLSVKKLKGKDEVIAEAAEAFEEVDSLPDLSNKQKSAIKDKIIDAVEAANGTQASGDTPAAEGSIDIADDSNGIDAAKSVGIGNIAKEVAVGELGEDEDSSVRDEIDDVIDSLESEIDDANGSESKIKLAQKRADAMIDVIRQAAHADDDINDKPESKLSDEEKSELNEKIEAVKSAALDAIEEAQNTAEVELALSKAEGQVDVIEGEADAYADINGLSGMSDEFKESLKSNVTDASDDAVAAIGAKEVDSDEEVAEAVDAGMAEIFIAAYLTDEDGSLFGEGNSDNYRQIKAASDNWNKLSEEAKLLVNGAIMNANGSNDLTYDELLKQANRYPKSSSGGSGGSSSTAYYTLSFDVNGGSAVDSVRKSIGTEVSLASYIPVREGYEFDGWYSDEAMTEKITSVKLTKNITVYAGWIEAEETPDSVKNPFTDVSESDWFCSDVMYVYEKGLMQGTAPDKFSPELTTTRGMIVTILWRLEGEPDENYTGELSDIAKDMYYAPAVDWAAANGILSGYGDGKFGADDPITREQMATILWRYAKYKGVDVSVGENTNILSYNDFTDLSEYAISAMQWACGAGIISGYDGYLTPGDSAIRGQVAAILHRYCELIAE